MFNMKLFLFVILSLFLVSVVSIATAQEYPNVFYIFIQIVQKDNDGNLIGYLESDDISINDYADLNQLVDLLVNDDDLIYDVYGKKIQVVKHTTPLTTDASGLLATIQFNASVGDIVYNVASISHDGMRLNFDEQVIAFWTFLRTV